MNYLLLAIALASLSGWTIYTFLTKKIIQGLSAQIKARDNVIRDLEDYMGRLNDQYRQLAKINEAMRDVNQIKTKGGKK
jgi:hypothetical protein